MRKIIFLFVIILIYTVQIDSQTTSSPNQPPIDCSVYTSQKTSAYIMPFEVDKSYEVWRTTEHYARGNGGVGL